MKDINIVVYMNHIQISKRGMEVNKKMVMQSGIKKIIS